MKKTSTKNTRKKETEELDVHFQETPGGNKKWYIRMFEPKEDKVENMNRQILHMAVLVAVLFLGLIGYLIKFQLYDSTKVVANPYNKRINTYGENMVRGTIYSANGKELALTNVDEKGEKERIYPYDNMFAHVVGMDSHGKMGLESICNYRLLTSNANPFALIFNSLKGEDNLGDNVITTLDTRIQKAAYNALGDRKGAVVVMEPSTGKVLAMVSKPDFDPNTISQDWEKYVGDGSKSNLLNRATQGLYPPGSTFKILTALSYIRQNPEDYGNYHYQCDSTILENSVKVSCYGGSTHGKVDLATSLAKSCNTSFVHLGCSLNQNKLRGLCETFFFNKEIDFDIDVKESTYKVSGMSDKSLIPQTVIGQGDTLVTPLHNAMIISAIANDGVLMKPYLVDSLTDFTGRTVKIYQPEKEGRLISEEEAAVMKEYLRQVVTDGTGSKLDVKDYKAAGKTGTAETGTGEDHAWFVGFTGMKKSKICVSVIVEQGGSGSRAAVPVAKAVFDAYYDNEMNR